jgi:hypothetical protein
MSTNSMFKLRQIHNLTNDMGVYSYFCSLYRTHQLKNIEYVRYTSKKFEKKKKIFDDKQKCQRIHHTRTTGKRNYQNLNLTYFYNPTN